MSVTVEQDPVFDPTEEQVFGSYTDNEGEEHHFCNEEIALAKLLVDDICFLNTRPYVSFTGWPKNGKEPNWDYTPDNCKKTTVVFVNCNDVWFWACADAEPVTTTEIPDLYRMHIQNKKWGSLKWACKKRDMQPQAPIRRDMKKEGAWCELMESLPPNPDDKQSQKQGEPQ